MDGQRVEQAIILAGGFGTRLRTILPDLPKPLAPVHGVPFIHYVLRWLEQNGVARIIACTGHLAEKMEAGFRSYGGRLQMTFQREDSPLGTGGAIYRALHEAGAGSAFALNGDTYFPADLHHFQAEARRLGGPFAVALRRLPDVSRYGAVDVDSGRILAMNEKGRQGPGLVNAGLYLLPGDLWRRFPMPDVFSWETDFLQPRAALLGPAGIALDAPFLDIGTPESYRETDTVLPPFSGSR